MPQTVEAISDGITVTFDNDSTEDNCKVTVTGNNVNGLKYNKTMWDTQGEFTNNNVSAAEIKIIMPIEGNGTYRLVTKNPTLKYYPNDDSIHQDELSGEFVKDKTHTIDDGSLELLVAVTNEKGPISIKLYDENNKLLKTFSVKNNVTFAKPYEASLKNDSTSVISKILLDNSEANELADKKIRVVAGNKICVQVEGNKKANLVVKAYDREIIGDYDAEVDKTAYEITVKDKAVHITMVDKI